MHTCQFSDKGAGLQMPLALRLAGCWLIWSAWCSASGWVLSAVNQLSGWGHFCLLPILLGAIWYWLKTTASPREDFSHFAKWRHRMSRPLPLIYVVIVVLSLLAGLISVAPWSFDAVTYRLPRLLYWWSAHHWYWIGTLDHRLDFSSAGFEWQMLPVIELTHTDRFIFLLNWIPFLLLPWLVFLAFRTLGVNGRSARRWMWLLPSGYCFALQCSGLQNDGYTANFVLAAVAFAGWSVHSRKAGGLWFALLSAALLTCAKVSNLPLLLPLGVLLLPVLTRVSWFNWRLPLVVLLALFCSFAPLTFLSWLNTGDWTGDPTDQWSVRTHGLFGGMAANMTLLVKDSCQPPWFPGSQHLNDALEGFNHSAFNQWLRNSHGEFGEVRFGDMVYEGQAGPGFGLAVYASFLFLGLCFFRAKPADSRLVPSTLPLAWRLVPWLAWLAYAVFLARLGSDHTQRIAAPYYPLLLVALLRLPRSVAWERKKFAAVLAVCTAASVLPVMLMTPARPLVPIQTIARVLHRPALDQLAVKYHFWDCLHDNLAPLREQIPSGVTQLGYAGGFRDTSYGLWKPLGQRVVMELQKPSNPNAPLVPADLKYAVATERGVIARYHMDLKTWLAAINGTVVFEFPLDQRLIAQAPPKYETWYLVKLGPN
jgi:hypothetical protein